MLSLHEFEFRMKAYQGLAFHLKKERSQETIFDLVMLGDQGEPPEAINKIPPDRLKELSKQTYTAEKTSFLTTQGDQPTTDERFVLGDYIERLEYEMYVVKYMGFITYMLVVSDYVQAARAMKIVVGPGRGSGAGSVLARCLMITDIDPLPYDLLFERFLNPARISMPDFDIDFEDTLREKVITYVGEKYGSENVCAIGTYMTLAKKAAFKDVARALGMSFDRSNFISRILPESCSVAEALASEKDEYAEFRGLVEHDELLQKTLGYAERLEGNLRQLGVHACGYIIAPHPTVQYTALFDGGEKGMVAHADGHVLEDLGLLKMDFLGLRNLSVIKNCLKIIKARRKQGVYTDNTDIDPGCWSVIDRFFDTMLFHPRMNDPVVFERVFKNGDTTGIFQFEGEGIRRFLMQLKPTDINDLFAMNALYRPGPLEFIPTYIRRKHGEEEVTYMLPDLQDILTRQYGPDSIADEERKLIDDLGPIMNVTYGIAVYQEQLMTLVQRMAGFTLAEADLLRRGVGKKVKEIIEQLKHEFMVKAENRRGYKQETARFIYEKMIEPAASYSFNKSHSVCYAYIAYQTGYLKAYFPLEFYAALLRSIEEDTDKLGPFITEVIDHGIEVKTPSVNDSFCHIAAIENHVRLGFLCIKGLGTNIAEGFENERINHGRFVSLTDFLTRCRSWINKKSLEGLVSIGALDEWYDRQTLEENIGGMINFASNAGQSDGGLFGEVISQDFVPSLATTSMSHLQKAMNELTMYKAFVSHHPFDFLYPLLKKFSFIQQVTRETFEGVFTLHTIIVGIQRAKKKGFFVMVEDATGRHELFFKDKMDFAVGDIWKVSGYKRGRYLSIDEIIVIDYDPRRVSHHGKMSRDFPIYRVRGAR